MSAALMTLKVCRAHEPPRSQLPGRVRAWPPVCFSQAGVWLILSGLPLRRNLPKVTMTSTGSRAALLELLRRYSPTVADRAPVVKQILSFVESEPECAERSHQFGHLTGSAWIVNPARTKALLLHHSKLNRWMQPGGHADGELDLLSVALKEAREESGLPRIEPISREVFDVDIHEIPQFKDIPAHYHFDVRFLLCADDSEQPCRNEESNEVKWIDLTDIHTYTEEESVSRLSAVAIERL